MLQAQSNSGLGHFTEEQIKERDAINQQVQTQQDIQNDRWFQQMRQQQYNPQLYQKVSNAVSQAKGGIRIETSSSTRTTNTSNHITQQQAQQIKKANKDAEHRAWLEQRRQAEAIAEKQRRIEEQRKREEQQRRYDNIRYSELQRTAAHYDQEQAKIAYRATEGRDFMYNYQPSGTEKIQSEYIPSQTKTTYDIASIISKSGNKPIVLNGNEYYKSSSNWDEMLLRTMKWIELPRKREYTSKNGRIWDEMRSKFDETQIQGIANAMKSTNIQTIEQLDENGNMTTKKVGVLPTALGINDKGNYIFEAVLGYGDEQRYDRVYSVSPDGVLTYATFEEHYFEDENIIKMVREGTFNDELKDSFKVKVEGGSLGLKDLKGESPKKLRNLLPQIKAEFKMNLFDNSSTVNAKWMYFAPESSIANTVIQMKDPTHSSFTVGMGGELSGGGKGEIKIGYGTNKWFTKPAEKSSDEDKEKHWRPKVKAGVTTAEAKAYVEAGSIKKVGKQFIQCNGTIQVKGSLELDYKTAINRNPLRGDNTVGWSCKIITTPEDQFPTERK